MNTQYETTRAVREEQIETLERLVMDGLLTDNELDTALRVIRVLKAEIEVNSRLSVGV